MRRFLVSALLAASALAQDAAPPAFEVASVSINRQGPSAEDEMRPMLQALLVDRFHFASHRETRRVEALVLIVPRIS